MKIPTTNDERRELAERLDEDAERLRCKYQVSGCIVILVNKEEIDSELYGNAAEATAASSTMTPSSCSTRCAK
jgi:hypothetical protein